MVLSKASSDVHRKWAKVIVLFQQQQHRLKTTHCVGFEHHVIESFVRTLFALPLATVARVRILTKYAIPSKQPTRRQTN